MPTPAYSRFIESMTIGFDQWHDGLGYDLQALAEIKADERSEVEEVLLAHLKDHPDWRDVEALRALGTPRAIDAARAADGRDDASIEDSLVRSIEQAHSLSELSQPLDLAERYPTARVKKALLDCARLGNAEIRVNAAAMLMFICGQAKEPFDWEQRPFFLKFGTDKTAELRECWHELRKRTGV